MKAIATLLIPFLCLAPVLAQDELSDAEAVEEIRRYTVEVVIFSYVEDVAVGGEQFFADEPPVEEEFDEFTEALGLVEELSVTPSIREFDLLNYAANPDQLKLVFLTEEEYTMMDIIDQFELLDVYETIMHFGWTQPTFPQEETEAIELSAFGELPEGLDGSFTLYLSRYLHLVVDLALEVTDDLESEDAIFDEPVPSYSDSRFQFDPEPVVRDMPVYYRIQENRIVKNGDIRYFDHPKFGVVAKVTRVEKEVEDPDPLLGLTAQ
jgi:hypothetical protein